MEMSHICINIRAHETEISENEWRWEWRSPSPLMAMGMAMGTGNGELFISFHIYSSKYFFDSHVPCSLCSIYLKTSHRVLHGTQEDSHARHL